MARRKITNSQAVCSTLLWGVLCYMLLVYSETINFDVIFALVASAIIVFVPMIFFTHFLFQLFASVKN